MRLAISSLYLAANALDDARETICETDLNTLSASDLADLAKAARRFSRAYEDAFPALESVAHIAVRDGAIIGVD